jgi:hypothetical protein
MRTVTLRDAEVELSRAASAAEAAREPEAVVILLYPDGSPFELYARAMVPAVASSYGRLSVLRIDTGREPSAPSRFGLSGAPGLVLFVGGKQLAAFASPMGGGLPDALGPAVQGILSSLGGLPGPLARPRPRGPAPVPGPVPLEIEGAALPADAEVIESEPGAEGRIGSEVGRDGSGGAA